MDWLQDNNIDETCCQALCQHPSCWESNLRQLKGFPRKLKKIPQPKILDDALPKQSVCNLLDDYGPSENDRYPSLWEGDGLEHKRAQSLPGLHSSAVDSFRNIVKCPNATPVTATPVQSHSRMLQLVAPLIPPRINKVEVQELFDVSDLQQDWNETFVGKQYYVWVPKATDKSTTPRQPEATQSVSIQQLSGGPKKLNMKDTTDQMIPKSIRKAKPTKQRERTSKSPTGGQPYKLDNIRKKKGKKRDSNMEEFIDLLKLPREVLIRILDEAEKGELMNRDKIREILEYYVSMLPDREKTTMSLTQSEVLHQHKVELVKGTQPGVRNLRQPEKFQSQQLYLLDTDKNNDLTPRDNETHSYEGLNVADLSDLDSYKGSHLSGKDEDSVADKESPRFTNKKPLPSISGGKAGSQSAGTKAKIPSISIGLPELAPGVKATKPFTYKRHQKQPDVNFSFSRVPTPPTTIDRAPTPKSESSEHGSTIHVTVPSIASEKEDPGASKKKEVVPVRTHRMRGLPAYSFSSRDRRDSAGLHAVSPAFSTNVPHTPVATPNTRQSKTNSVGLGPGYIAPENTGFSLPSSPVKSLKEGIVSPINFGLKVPSNTPIHPPGSPLSPEHTGILDTIVESSNGSVTGEVPTRDAGPVPQSRGRSVHFAQDIMPPPQPPCSPQLTEGDITITTSSSPPPQESPDQKSQRSAGSRSISVKIPAAQVDSSYRGTSMRPQSQASEDGLDPVSPIGVILEETTRPGSGEEWPNVNEDDFNVTPAPSEKVISPEPPESHQGNIDVKSERSGLTSMLKSEGRESLASAKAKRMIEGDIMDSPGPPPSSPEPKQTLDMRRQTLSAVSRELSMDILEEVAETDSDITLSGDPPSRLDNSCLVTPELSGAPPGGSATKATQPTGNYLMVSNSAKNVTESEQTAQSDENQNVTLQYDIDASKTEAGKETSEDNETLTEENKEMSALNNKLDSVETGGEDTYREELREELSKLSMNKDKEVLPEK
ncbi:unnamed protein product [Owenia fusiformis]|uniref:Uncharacterized protein n=1 Tax=Owenia fusiformis TaxID=6347 RepID=A0A8J1U3F4_OWEFU|nr:unnamed protein product [Owenia fusiformis]